MTPASQPVQIKGPAGLIDCTVDQAPGRCAGVALVAHPHPLFGGNRDNKVVQTLGRALLSLGYTVWLPDFRGVRASAGVYDDGYGEVDDLAAVAQFACAQNPMNGSAPALVLAGFSFGAMVCSRLATRLVQLHRPAQRLILVGTATSRWAVDPVAANTLVIHGEQDEVVPLASVLDWARGQDLPVTVIPGADHFFHRRLPILKRLVLQAWGRDAQDL